MAMVSLTLRLIWCCPDNYIGQTARSLPFVRYLDQRTPVPWYFCRFWALPGHRSQHQPTQCKSTTWRKQHHHAQSEGGHCYNIKQGNAPWLWMRDWTYHQFTILPWGFCYATCHLTTLMTSEWLERNIHLYLGFSLWVLEFSVLNDNNNNNNNNSNNNNNNDDDDQCFHWNAKKRWYLHLNNDTITIQWNLY